MPGVLIHRDCGLCASGAMVAFSRTGNYHGGVMIVRQCKNRQEISAALEVRRRVFVVEQKMDAALEFDGRDEGALHFIAYDGEKAVGAARLLRRGEEAEIGRVAVPADYRLRGVGAQLMQEAEAAARRLGLKTAVIHAQSRTVEMYRKLGYEKTSDEFTEAGIPHVEMRKTLPPPDSVRCKLCGEKNAYLSGRDREVVCAKCGYRMSGRDLWKAV